MTDQLFERYKEALREGHVAVLRGRLEDALDAYRRATEIAPGRALPHTSLGGVLLDLGRFDDALEELRIALELAPREEGALLGRAEALARTGQRGAAAAALDTLSDVLLETDREADAVETLQRALVLEERVSRRRRYQRALRALRMASGDRVSDQVFARALAVLEPTEGSATPAAEAAGAPPPAVEEAPVEDAPVEEVPAPEGAAAATPVEAGSGEEPPPVDGATAAAGGGPAAPEAEAPPPEPRLAGDALIAAAEVAVTRGDPAAALEAYRDAARVFDEAGLAVAALDACREALALAPGDVGIHLRYASVYRSRGWRDMAAGRLASILRFVDLTADAEGRAEICATIAALYPDDDRLMGLCA